MADAKIRLEDLWDARYKDPGAEFTITGIASESDGLVQPLLLNEVSKSASFTLTADDARKRIVVTEADVVITLPAVGELGNGFEVEVINDTTGDVTVDGTGVLNYTFGPGQFGMIVEAGSKQRVWSTDSTLVADSYAGPPLWDPTVMGFDLVHWWDATKNVQIDSSSGSLQNWVDPVDFQYSGGGGLGQGSFVNQPEWLRGNEIRFEGAHRYVTGAQTGRSYENRWVLMLFRINWTATAQFTDQYMVAFNGNTTGIGARVPMFSLYSTTRKIRCIFFTSDATSQEVFLDVPGGDDQWHTLVFRRDEDAVYGSIDGGAEVSLAGYPRTFTPTVLNTQNFIGNKDIQVFSWGLDSLVVGQGHLSSDDVAKMHGWGMWRRGAEAFLNASSPYLGAAPTMVQSDVRVHTPDAYADGWRFSAAWDDTLRGQALSLSGFTRTFHDHFTDIATITDGFSGHGPNWWAPAHIDTSTARYLRPVDSGITDTYTILPDNTTLQIKMQQKSNTGLWFSGHIQSADVWGNGFLQSVPNGGAVYYEARMAFNGLGGNATVGQTSNSPGWVAFWLYSQALYKDSAATKAEIDIVECYGAGNATTNKEMHITYHNHGAYRPQPGNYGSPQIPAGTAFRTPSHITDMTAAPFNSPTVLFDGLGAGNPGTFHTYGVKIDQTWITSYFDGKLVGRYPAYKEALGPMFMLISLQAQDGLDPTLFPLKETYMWVDYVDAYSTSP